MNKIKFIFNLILFITISCCVTSSYAATDVNFDISKNIVINEQIIVKLENFDGLYGFQADVKIKFSDNSEESKKIVYIKDFKDYDSLEISFNAKKDGLAKVYISNIIATDLNNTRIELNETKKEYSIIIASINDVDVDDTLVDDSKISNLKINKLNNKKYVNVENSIKVGDIITSNNFCNIDNMYKINAYSKNNLLKSQSDKLGSRDKIIITDKNDNIITKYNIIVKGDVSGNGEIKLYDAFTILRSTLRDEKLDDFDTQIRDYDGDGNVKLYDAFSFLRKALNN